MRLHQQLSPPGPYDSAEWEIGELLAVWWRPNFETFMVKLHARPRFANADHLNDNFSQYPYVPAHITYPKEQKKLFIIHLPERSECRLGKETGHTTTTIFLKSFYRFRKI